MSGNDSNVVKVCGECGKTKPVYMFLRSNSTVCEDCKLGSSKKQRRFIQTDDGKVLKLCTLCGKYRSIEVFMLNHTYRGGRNTTCADCHRDYAVRYRKTDKGKANQKRAIGTYYKKVVVQDPVKLKATRLATRLNYALRSALEFNEELGEAVGCSLAEWRKYIEGLFRDGMTWDNYGKLWAIDHANPRRNFDLRESADRKSCLHWTNTRPVLVSENTRHHNDRCGAYGALEPIPCTKPTYVPGWGELGPQDVVGFDEHGTISRVTVN